MMSNENQLLTGRQLEGGASSSLFIDGKRFLNFGGCNYLALTNRAELRDAALNALENGCLFARYLHIDYGGNVASFDRVEREAAVFFGTQSAIYLPSGYHLGFASLTGLEPYLDVVVLDEQAHWCLSQAAVLSGAQVKYFTHCDPDALEKILEDLADHERPLIATDGAFATSGRMPPLDCYSELAERFDGQLLVDESHSAGVIGNTGRGALQHFGIRERAYAATTLSKAFCGHGAVFTGPKEMTERARQTPAVRGSNAGSPISAEVSAASLRLVRENPELCADVRSKTSYLRKGLRSIGLEVIESPSSIVSFCWGGFEEMRAIQTSLFEDGIYVMHSNYIAAGPGGTIRLTVFADHTLEDLDNLIQKIRVLVATE